MSAPEQRAERVAEVLTAAIGLGREIGAAWPAFSGRRLSRRQVDVLYVLAHHPEPVTPSRLAVVLGVTPGAVTQLVDHLQGDGFLTREPHPEDARSFVLRLNPEARAEITASEQQVVDDFTPRFASLTDRELSLLADLLRRLSP